MEKAKPKNKLKFKTMLEFIKHQIDIAKNSGSAIILIIPWIEFTIYATLLDLYKKTLINQRKLKDPEYAIKISENIREDILTKFGHLFNTADKLLDYQGGGDTFKITNDALEQINPETYAQFKKELSKIDAGALNLISELEREEQFELCEKELSEFIKKCEKSCTNDYISNFNKFDLIIDSKEDIELVDEDGNFSGLYVKSQNNRFIIAYNLGYIDEDGRNIKGQVYLIKDKQKILWKKAISDPDNVILTNEGNVALSGNGKELYYFDKSGKQLYKQSFKSDIAYQVLSPTEKEIILSTACLDNALYLFSIIKPIHLIKKVKNNLSKKPILYSKFNDMKEYILENN